MADYLAEHWVMSILITIFLGALGSGLWEAICRPGLVRIRGLLFSILSFGAKRASDRVFREAARGHHDLPSTFILLIVLTIPFAFVVNAALIWEFDIDKYLSTKLETKSIPPQCVAKPDEEQKDCMRDARKERLSLIFRIVILGGIFISVIFLYEFMFINGANLAVTYYEQCLKIARPYMSAEDLLRLEHDFALMQSKDDYRKILGTLSAIAAKHDINLPANSLLPRRT